LLKVTRDRIENFSSWQIRKHRHNGRTKEQACLNGAQLFDKEKIFEQEKKRRERQNFKHRQGRKN